MTENLPQNSSPMGWIDALGKRNLAYILFVIILIPLANMLEARGPQGPDAGGGIMLGIIVWVLISAVFFVINAVMLIMALVKGGNVQKPMVACLLPVAVIVATLMAEEIWLR